MGINGDNWNLFYLVGNIVQQRDPERMGENVHEDGGRTIRHDRVSRCLQLVQAMSCSPHARNGSFYRGKNTGQCLVVLGHWKIAVIKIGNFIYVWATKKGVLLLLYNLTLCHRTGRIENGMKMLHNKQVSQFQKSWAYPLVKFEEEGNISQQVLRL